MLVLDCPSSISTIAGSFNVMCDPVTSFFGTANSI